MHWQSPPLKNKQKSKSMGYMCVTEWNTTRFHQWIILFFIHHYSGCELEEKFAVLHSQSLFLSVCFSLLSLHTHTHSHTHMLMHMCAHTPYKLVKTKLNHLGQCFLKFFEALPRSYLNVPAIARIHNSWKWWPSLWYSFTSPVWSCTKD